MKVNIKLHLNQHHPKIVYGRIYDAVTGELIAGATLDYCLSRCEKHEDEIVNAQDVLTWLLYNADFVASAQYGLTSFSYTV